MAVLQILYSLHANELFWGECLRNVLMILASRSINLVAIHISGVENRKADTLTRLVIYEEEYAWVRERETVRERVAAEVFMIDFSL